MSLPAKKKNEELLTTSQLLSDLGISRARLSELTASGVIPKASRGFFPRSAIRAYCENLRNVAAGRGGHEGVARLTEERARLAHEQANAAALKNAQARRDLLPADEVSRHWDNMCAAIRSRVLAIPSSLPAALSHLTRADLDVLDHELRNALTELADNLDERADAQ